LLASERIWHYLWTLRLVPVAVRRRRLENLYKLLIMRMLHMPIPSMGRTLQAFVFLLLCGSVGSLDAQVPLHREDRGITRITHTWYPPAEQGSIMESKPVVWSKVEVHHGASGQPELVVVDGEEHSQRVNFRYDDRGDLVERIHRFPDSTMKRYTWKHRYDEQDRLLERTAYDAEGKLLSQEIKLYDDQGRVTDHAAFYRRYTDGDSWTFLEEESGLKRYDANMYRMDSRHYYNDWIDRLYLTKLTPFSLIPPDDAFQRFQYSYEGDAESPTKVMLYDQAGRLVEEDECHHDGRGRLRSVNSKMYLDSLQWVWDFRYDDRGNIEQSRYVDAANMKNTLMLRTSYEMEGDRLRSKTVQKVRANTTNYTYREDGTLEAKEERDLFNKLISRTLFHEDGRIKEYWRFNDEEQVDSVFSYAYE
jgi:hypothetical protein